MFNGLEIIPGDVAVCINTNDSHGQLTIGKNYRVKDVFEDRWMGSMIVIDDDTVKNAQWCARRFKFCKLPTTLNVTEEDIPTAIDILGV